MVGAGFFGGLHARKYAGLPNVTLVGIADIDAEAAGKLAAELGADAVTNLSEMIDEIDLVSIASPACFHFDLARQAIEAGLHTYVEKPIALSVAEADELVQLAEDKGVVLQVGHQERFVFTEFGLFSRRRTPLRIECCRAGPFTGRAMDVSVVLDLMIHDLDLVHQVAPSPVTKVKAVSKRLHGEHEDEVDACLTLSDGCEVRLLASRMADARKRYMKIEYDDGLVEIDFINRTLKNSTGADITPVFQSADGEMPSVADDPLGYAIASFVNSARENSEPFVTGADARRALATALSVIEACQATKHVS